MSETKLVKNNVKPIIEIQNLSHIYNEGTTFEGIALKDINIEIYEGEFIGIIGHTGSGKSTLIQHLNALLKPTSGSVLLNGFDINSDKKHLKKIRQKVGLVFQYPEHQLFETDVYKDVAFGPHNIGLSSEEIDKRVRDALHLVGISEDIYSMSPFELSGGQKRRVAIAGVLAMKPDVLILDEPTAGLDPAGRDAILSQIDTMHKIVKNTVILISHNMEDVSKYSDRIVVMAEGQIVLSGTPEEVFSRPDDLVKVNLAPPPVAVLMELLRKEGIDVKQGIFTVEDAADALSELL